MSALIVPESVWILLRWFPPASLPRRKARATHKQAFRNYTYWLTFEKPISCLSRGSGAAMLVLGLEKILATYPKRPNRSARDFSRYPHANWQTFESRRHDCVSAARQEPDLDDLAFALKSFRYTFSTTENFRESLLSPQRATIRGSKPARFRFRFSFKYSVWGSRFLALPI
jgi:hypothetical protein